MKVRIKGVVDMGQGDKKLVIKGKIRSYKPKKISKVEQENMQLILRNGASCDCDAAEKANKSSLVTPSRVDNETVVTYVSDWGNSKVFKQAIHAMRKGHDCKLKIDSQPGQTDANSGGLSIDGSPLPTIGSPEMDNRTNGRKGGKKKGKGKGKKRRGKKKDRERGKKKDDDELPNIGELATNFLTTRNYTEYSTC